MKPILQKGLIAPGDEMKIKENVDKLLAIGEEMNSKKDMTMDDLDHFKEALDLIKKDFESMIATSQRMKAILNEFLMKIEEFNTSYEKIKREMNQ